MIILFLKNICPIILLLSFCLISPHWMFSEQSGLVILDCLFTLKSDASKVDWNCVCRGRACQDVGFNLG